MLAFLFAAALLAGFWYLFFVHEPLEANIHRRKEMDAINESLRRFAAGDYIVTTGDIASCYKVESVSLGSYSKSKFSERVSVINAPSMHVEEIATKVGRWATPNEMKYFDLINYNERNSTGGKSQIYLFRHVGNEPSPNFRGLRKVDQKELMTILNEAKLFEEQRIEREHRKRLEEEAKEKAFVEIQHDAVDDMLREIKKLRQQWK